MPVCVERVCLQGYLGVCTCSNSVMANFWWGMQCLAVQMSSLVSSEMWKWIRIRRVSYKENRDQCVTSGSSTSVCVCVCVCVCVPVCLCVCRAGERCRV